MESAERIVTYTGEELREIILRGEDETDYAYLDAMTEEELEASIDPEEEAGFGAGPFLRGFPSVSREVAVGIDSDLVEWFDDPTEGPGPRINAVLRGYVEGRRREERDACRADEARAGEAA